MLDYGYLLHDLFTIIGFYLTAAYCIVIEFYVDRIRKYDGLSRLEYLRRTITASKLVRSARGERKLVAVITGANGTIGAEITRLLLQNDFKTICLVSDRDNSSGWMRTNDLMAVAECVVRTVDLANLSEVHKMARSLSDEFPHIDLIICNAGIMLHPFRLTADGFETHFAVNLLSHAALVDGLLMMPKAEQQSAGGESLLAEKCTDESRVVFISSATVHLGDLHGVSAAVGNPGIFTNYRNGYQAYATSKLAVSLYTEELQNALRERKESAMSQAVTVISAHPGCVASDLYQHVNSCSKVLISKFLRPLMRNPAVAAAEIVALGCADRLEGGCYYQHMVPTRILCTVTTKQQQRELYQQVQNTIVRKF